MKDNRHIPGIAMLATGFCIAAVLHWVTHVRQARADQPNPHPRAVTAQNVAEMRDQLLKDRQAVVAAILAALQDPNAAAETRAWAIELAGQYRVFEACPWLIENHQFGVGDPAFLMTDVLTGKDRRTRFGLCRDALIRIGTPANHLLAMAIVDCNDGPKQAAYIDSLIFIDGAQCARTRVLEQARTRQVAEKQIFMLKTAFDAHERGAGVGRIDPHEVLSEVPTDAK